jgi:tetratricopeptide (TPR) repeat protein
MWRATRRLSIAVLCAAAFALTTEIAYRAALRFNVHYAPNAAFELYGIGESTMVGEPFEPKISVPRLLEYMFGGEIAGRPMDVANLAERGAPLYPQSAAFERALAGRKVGAPGAVLIMSGHNEGYVPGALGAWHPYVPNILADRSAIVRDVLLALRRRHLIDRERSLAAYEYYLRLVIETAQANGIVPILTTMASNVSRIEPNATAITPERVTAVVAQGLALEGEGRHREARDLYLSNLTDDSSSAVLYYRAGRCEETLGDFDAAHEHYWMAVDRDPRLTFGRATRAQNELVRQLAREYGVPLVDAVQIFEEQSPHGIIGDDLFMDGQHPTIAGYLQLANAYARILSERFDTPIRQPLRDEQEAAAALGFGPADMPRALIDSGSWLVATSVYHPFPKDRMALAEQRFRSLLGKGDDFSAWFGMALTQAAARGGMLRSADDVRALGSLAGYQESYSVAPTDMPALLARFEKFGVDAEVIEQLRKAGGRN